MAKDPELRAHSQWIGLLQPVGLVVSPPALVAAGAQVDSNIKREQDALQRLVETPVDGGRPSVRDLPRLLVEVLGWQENDLVGGPAHPEQVQRFDVALPDYEETLQATFAVPASKTGDACLMLCMTLPSSTDPDDAKVFADRRWQASAQSRFERLLWENGIPIGLLFNGTDLRLCYVPRGESSGHVTFPIDEMCRVPGRPILGALKMLLGADRLFSLPSKQRLPAILEESRKYQSLVSNALSEQVLTALRELLTGFQAADEYTQGKLLGDVLREAPQEVYGGLLATLLRLVFVLYAEDRGLTPDDPVYLRSYSLGRLFERLREDAALYPDTMGQRYGAWAQLLSLFRLIFDGAEYVDPGTAKAVRLPPRQGHLFNPDSYPFLEGRPYQTLRVMGDRYIPPRVADGVVYRVLESLMLLDGQRLSYRSLDVEQIGSVYEALMGFELQVATGASIAVRPDHVVINLNELLDAKPADREKLLKDQARCELADKAKKAAKDARTVDELMAALDRRVSPRTPSVIPLGGLYLQPTEERRRSGSHYTPRSLTLPIVKTALKPVLENLGENPKPERVLELKICDPAMGSGAFLVEACRQLAEKLVDSWTRHNAMPAVPPDEDPLLHARRVVAQRCLYGVDKNRFAVDLAKLSLWLATLAKDHPFTFLDHALKHGDSLVGITRRQIAQFQWKGDGGAGGMDVAERFIDQPIGRADHARQQIETLGDDVSPAQKNELLREAEAAISQVRMIGDLVLAAFFAAEKEKDRERERTRLLGDVELWLGAKKHSTELESAVFSLRDGSRPVTPFHWDVEFPEVFGPERGGFDAFVGNPPFAGKNTIAAGQHPRFAEWLKVLHEGSHGNADLVAHFFRRAFALLRNGGCFGLLATNTIGQGDTRDTGLKWIRKHEGTIYAAQRRVRWPGQAAVITSIVHVQKERHIDHLLLDGREVAMISAFLFHAGGDEEPQALVANRGSSFQGVIPLGMGFTFDDTKKDGVTSLSEMQRLVAADRRNGEVIFPFIGYEEVATSPIHAYHRYIIDFADMSEADARQWPELMSIVESLVKPARMTDNRKTYRDHWWQFAEKRVDLRRAIRELKRVLVTASQASEHLAFAFLPANYVFSSNLNVFALDSWSAFCVLQSRPHEVWSRFFGSTLHDRLSYTPTTCYETYPFCLNWRGQEALERAGEEYCAFRAALMAETGEGLTKIYNRFNDPDDSTPGILRLRDLHDQLDRKVLDAYGWDKVKPRCEFILDYEEEEDAEGESDGGHRRRRKRPWRFRWPDEIRDEVLARLLELNTTRAEEERRLGDEAGQGTAKKKPKSPARKKTKVPVGQAALSLVGEGESDK